MYLEVIPISLLPVMCCIQHIIITHRMSVDLGTGTGSGAVIHSQKLTIKKKILLVHCKCKGSKREEARKKKASLTGKY